MGKLKRLPPPPPGINGYIGDLFTTFFFGWAAFFFRWRPFCYFFLVMEDLFINVAALFCPYGGLLLLALPPTNISVGGAWLQSLLLDAKPYSTSKMFIVNDVLSIAEMGLKL